MMSRVANRDDAPKANIKVTSQKGGFGHYVDRSPGHYHHHRATIRRELLNLVSYLKFVAGIATSFPDLPRQVDEPYELVLKSFDII